MASQVAVKGPERTATVKVWNDQIDLKVNIAGKGPAAIYFHPAAGLYWDRFLDSLAEDYTVFAPEMPGTSVGDPYAIHKVDTYWDLLLLYEEALRKLSVDRAVAVGQSMGGMVACDLAANFTSVFSKLICLDPVGLWRDDTPVMTADLYAAPPQKVPEYLFHDPASPAAQAMFAMPEDPAEIPAHVARAVWTLGCSGKFLWPFPDQGLGKRLHRVEVPTLVIWGKQDKLVPAVYADEFRTRIKGARVEIIDQCGHIPQIEQFETTVGLVRQFLAS